MKLRCFIQTVSESNLVYEDGKVCISILHPPGKDVYNPDEKESERWLPIHTAESIIICVLAMLNDPNIDSPANIDAAKMFRDDPAGY